MEGLRFILTLYLTCLVAGDQNTSARDGKSLFVIVNFPNEECTTTTGYNGTCMAPSECIGTGGAALGSCAKGFGICCYYYLRGCGGVQAYNQTYLQNPNWPGPVTVDQDLECTFTFPRLHSQVCQLRLDFAQFELGPPISDRVLCTSTTPATDTLTLVHAGGRTEPTLLCGYNTGHHVYLDMASTDTMAFIRFRLDSTRFGTFNRIWNIKASQIECNKNYHAPQGCLQYYYGDHGVGSVTAFNYDNPTTAYVGHLAGSYSICVRRESGMCVIGWTPPQYSQDPLGFSISGRDTSDHARGSCRYSSDPAYTSPYPAQSECKQQYISIPDNTGNSDGSGPFTHTSLARDGNPVTTCQRMCGKKFCLGGDVCRGSADHQVVYSRRLPFEMRVTFDSTGFSPQTFMNKGFKLNYFQLPC